MQWVEANAATIGIKDRIGQQVVEIDEVCCCDYQTRDFPSLAPEYHRDQERGEPMPAIVEERLE